MLAPGIDYVQARVPKGAGDALRADIVGLAGIFERGPVLLARRVEDWGEQRKIYGDYVRIPGTNKLAFGPLAAQGFFQNGGATSIFFRLASRGMRAATARFRDFVTGAEIGLVASSPGAWGNRLTLRAPLHVTRRVATALPAPLDIGLRAGDIVRVRGAGGALAFGRLRESSGALDLSPAPATPITSPIVEV